MTLLSVLLSLAILQPIGPFEKETLPDGTVRTEIAATITESTQFTVPVRYGSHESDLDIALEELGNVLQPGELGTDKTLASGASIHLPDDISIGGISLGSMDFVAQREQQEGFLSNGSIGLNAFRNCTIGLDLNTRTFAIWTGKKRESDVASWVRSGYPKTSETLTINLLHKKGKLPVLEALLRDKKRLMYIVSTRVAAMLNIAKEHRDTFVPTKNVSAYMSPTRTFKPVELGIATEFEIPGLPRSWILTVPEVMTEVLGGNLFDPQESISIWNLPANRIAIDVERSKLYLPKVDKYQAWSVLVSRLISAPIAISKEGIRFAEVDLAGQFRNDKILEISGAESNFLLEKLTSGGPDLLGVLATLSKLGDETYYIMLIEHDGKPYRLRVKIK